MLHFTLTAMGGGERVGASTVEALNKIGIVPDFIGPSPVYREQLMKHFGKNLDMNVKSILPFQLMIFGLYQRLLMNVFLANLRGYDVVVNTTGSGVPKRFRPKKYVLYIYNPMIKPDIDKYERGFWKIYYKIFEKLAVPSYSDLEGITLLAVSEFTRQRIRKYWGVDATTIYPPVAIGDFVGKEEYSREGVISIARFTPEKNHFWQLEIAKQLPDMKFRLCGSAVTPYYRYWLEVIQNHAKKLNLKNVEFHVNLPFDRLVDLVHKSKYFIHTMKNEDFGLTTCEAIAGGCIPVVHNSGGQIEIVPYRELRFDTVEEAVNVLSNIERKPLDEYKRNLFEHIKEYNEDKFQEQMLNAMGIIRKH